MAEHGESLKKALNEFSVDLYKQIASQPENTTNNIFLSPLSISSALLLVYEGAKETTKKEIESALHLDKQFGEKRDAVFQAYEEVLRIFVPGKGDDGHPAYNLALANKAYVHNGLNLKPDYVSVIQNNLKSEIAQVDFQKNGEGARQEINHWVEKQTNDKIKDLLAVGSVKPSTLLVLVNAIYFKADWLKKFSETDTKKDTFHNLNGEDVQVDLMAKTKEEKYEYFDNFETSSDEKSPLPPFQMLVIPYKQHELTMLIFLPRDRTGLKEFEGALNVEVLQKLYDQSVSRKAKVWLPRFKLTETYDLIEILRKTGVKQLFGPHADLSGITDVPLSVSEAVHKAFVEVNEKGTEAAAATAIMMTRCAMPMREPPPVEFRADRPFLFAIRHESTGLITFMGRVVKL